MAWTNKGAIVVVRDGQFLDIYCKIEPLRIVGGQNIGQKRRRRAKNGSQDIGLSKLEGWRCSQL